MKAKPPQNQSGPRLREIDELTDRGRVMAKLAQKIGHGSDSIYHGTRHLVDVLRCGKLLPISNAESGVFLSRSPATAAYFATLWGSQADRYSPGVLVLNRRSLTQSYRLEPSRYDEESEQDEREEVVWNRTVNVRRHLLGVVSDANVTSILGPPRYRYLPQTFFSWSLARRSIFTRKAIEAGDKLVRKGRIKVRAIIVSDRRRRSMENARLSVAAHCASDPVIKPTKKTRARQRQTNLPMLPTKKQEEGRNGDDKSPRSP